MLSASDIPATLTPQERLRFAQQAFSEFHTECFWPMPENFVVTDGNLSIVIQELKLSGGHRGWKLAAALCH